jgi:hypothetical protein
MIKWAIKKYLIGKVNEILEVNSTNVTNTKNKLDTWIGRLQRILDCLKNILSKLDDNKLDSQEIDDSVADIEKVVKQW